MTGVDLTLSSRRWMMRWYSDDRYHGSAVALSGNWKMGSPRHLGVTGAPRYPEIPAYGAILSARDPIANRTPREQPSRRCERIRTARAPSPLDRDDGGAGGGAVKVAGSLPLASLGDSPAVRRDAPPRSNRGRGLPFAVPAINSRREPGLRTQPAPPCSGAGRVSTARSSPGHPGTAPVTPKSRGVPENDGARRR